MCVVRASALLRRLLGGGGLGPGHVADDLLADEEGLVAGLARLRLARRGGVGIGVRVQVVVLGARDAPVGRRRGGAALVVGPLRSGDDDEALTGAVLVADAEQAGYVAEPEGHVVTD